MQSKGNFIIIECGIAGWTVQHIKQLNKQEV